MLTFFLLENTCSNGSTTFQKSLHTFPGSTPASCINVIQLYLSVGDASVFDVSYFLFEGVVQQQYQLPIYL